MYFISIQYYGVSNEYLLAIIVIYAATHSTQVSWQGRLKYPSNPLKWKKRQKNLQSER